MRDLARRADDVPCNHQLQPGNLAVSDRSSLRRTGLLRRMMAGCADHRRRPLIVSDQAAPGFHGLIDSPEESMPGGSATLDTSDCAAGIATELTQFLLRQASPLPPRPELLAKPRSCGHDPIRPADLPPRARTGSRCGGPGTGVCHAARP
jgi:hypothetical protein